MKTMIQFLNKKNIFKANNPFNLNGLAARAVALVLLLCSTSCGKDYLEKKANQSLLVPVSYADFMALLDNLEVMNVTPAIQHLSADEYEFTDVVLQGIAFEERNSYLWATDIYQGKRMLDWNIPYQQVFYCNVVLDGLKKITPTALDEKQYKEIKAMALYSRAYAYYNLVQLFCKPYTLAVPNTDLGVPLKLNSDVNEMPGRGKLDAVYAQIISDLESCVADLPLQTVSTSRPKKAAGYALLARLYLSVSAYDLALLNANKALALHPTLLDLNSVAVITGRPFTQALPDANPEIIYFSVIIPNYPTNSASTSYMNKELYAQYETADLRKTLFFTDRSNGNFSFRGSFSGRGRVDLFSGLTTGEMLLTSAECYARANRVGDALNDLNTLLVKRWNKNEAYPTVTATDAADALAKILKERRKEMVNRGTRWTDLRRLNQDPAFAKTLLRNNFGLTYTLPPGDKKYTFAIPDGEFLFQQMEQNER